MIDRETRLRLLGLDQLPTLPEIMVRILQTIEDDDSSAEDLGTLLEQDHSITARLLRLANSAFYGFPTQVETVRRAIVLIGYNEVRLLALATSVFDTFSRLRQFALDPHDYWMHSLGAAKAASALSAHVPLRGEPQACFTAGLLHDMGKYALATALERTYKLVLRDAADKNCLVMDAEQRVLNTTHAEVGAWLAEEWNFPESIRQPIRDLYTCRTDSACYKESMIVALADQISRLAGYGNAGDPPGEPVCENLVRGLHLTTDAIAQHIDNLKKQRSSAEALLDILTGE